MFYYFGLMSCVNPEVKPTLAINQTWNFGLLRKSEVVLSLGPWKSALWLLPKLAVVAQVQHSIASKRWESRRLHYLLAYGLLPLNSMNLLQ